MNYLNLGCGKRYHCNWTNVDFTAIGEDVIGHNLLNGIPFKDESFDAIYHSHVLEHFSKNDGLAFIRECFRVIRIGGVIRIAVPDFGENSFGIPTKLQKSSEWRFVSGG
jgi:predicted SAM-dependent methyltransferase